MTLLLLGPHAVARRRGISVRTLQRRLEEAGSNLTGLVREARRRLALRCLAEGLSLERTAATLGFSGAAAVSRFLRREFGVPSSKLRGRAEERARDP